MAKNWGRNTSKQELINKNIVQQVDITYYVMCNIVAQKMRNIKFVIKQFSRPYRTTGTHFHAHIELQAHIFTPI